MLLASVDDSVNTPSATLRPSADARALPHGATVREALAWATSLLSHAGVLSPRLDAEVLLAHILGWKRARLYAIPEFELTDAQSQAFLASIERRRRHEPVPYIVEHREFYGLDFVVDRRVLIPRPETELLVERALETATQLGVKGQRLILADIGTGSGIVAISLAVNLPGVTVYAADARPESLEVAALNAARHGVSGRVHLRHGNLLDPLPERVHIIVANLPYVPTKLLAFLAPDVVAYEPLAALDGGEDGLLHIRRLLAQAGRWLLPNGAILLEIGAGQGEEVVALSSQHYVAAKVELFQDYAGLERIVRIST